MSVGALFSGHQLATDAVSADHLVTHIDLRALQNGCRSQILGEVNRHRRTLPTNWSSTFGATLMALRHRLAVAVAEHFGEKADSSNSSSSNSSSSNSRSSGSSSSSSNRSIGLQNANLRANSSSWASAACLLDSRRSGGDRAPQSEWSGVDSCVADSRMGVFSQVYGVERKLTSFPLVRLPDDWVKWDGCGIGESGLREYFASWSRLKLKLYFVFAFVPAGLAAWALKLPDDDDVTVELDNAEQKKHGKKHKEKDHHAAPKSFKKGKGKHRAK